MEWGRLIPSGQSQAIETRQAYGKQQRHNWLIPSGQSQAIETKIVFTQTSTKTTATAKELKRLINDNWPNCKCEIKDFAYDDHSPEFPRDFIASLRGRIEDYLTGVKDADVVFDIDRGTTMHKLALCKLIRPDNWLTTLTHGLKNGKIEHGTESLKLWQYSDDWTQPFRLHAGGTEIGEQEKLF